MPCIPLPTREAVQDSAIIDWWLVSRISSQYHVAHPVVTPSQHSFAGDRRNVQPRERRHPAVRTTKSRSKQASSTSFVNLQASDVRSPPSTRRNQRRMLDRGRGLPPESRHVTSAVTQDESPCHARYDEDLATTRRLAAAASASVSADRIDGELGS